jgi:hypothetical protein
MAESPITIDSNPDPADVQLLEEQINTHSFQAPGFYQKLGYTVSASYDDYPVG